jgi:AraC-like DNA-binding protein
LFHLRHAEFSRAISRLAVLRAGGIAGTIAEGFFRVLAPPCTVAVFDSADHLAAWVNTVDVLPVLQQLTALHAECGGTDPVVRDLHAVLETAPAQMDLARAAQALGISVRTLQRRLRVRGVRFKNELAQARVRLAMRRLCEPVKLTSLASELGFASPQHFSTCFRQITGISPSEWRKRSPRAPTWLLPRHGR